MDLGERLRTARKKRDMSQTQVAQVLGVSQELVAKIEAGEREGDAGLKGLINRWIATGRGPNRPQAAKRGAYRERG